MRRFFFLFIGLMLVMFYIDLLVPVQQHVIVPFTTFLARTSGYIAMMFDSNVIFYDRVLTNRMTGGGVMIDNGCNGVEACIVLTSGMLAFPTTWRQKVLGIITGLLAVQELNVIRIVCLFFLSQWDKQIFEFLHVYLWPSLIMLDVLVVFLFWMKDCQDKLPQPQPEPDVVQPA